MEWNGEGELTRFNRILLNPLSHPSRACGGGRINSVEDHIDEDISGSRQRGRWRRRGVSQIGRDSEMKRRVMEEGSREKESRSTMARRSWKGMGRENKVERLNDKQRDARTMWR